MVSVSDRRVLANDVYVSTSTTSNIYHLDQVLGSLPTLPWKASAHGISAGWCLRMPTHRRKTMPGCKDIDYFVFYHVVQAVIPTTFHRQISRGLNRNRLDKASENRIRGELSALRILKGRRRRLGSLKSISGLTRRRANPSHAHSVVFALAHLPYKATGIILRFMCNDGVARRK